ncbi:hypothetical protein [Myxococcus eversor]|uniref:hypothetical protein n=1 Tax=Myxococcus eversor TaxID=2709661 RepID=UPI0013D3A325|nr:hypothetical protein [Myxococcus eversor]
MTTRAQLQYPFDHGVADAPVDVYGKPGRGPVVIDAGWGTLLPTNLTHPWYRS